MKRSMSLWALSLVLVTCTSQTASPTTTAKLSAVRGVVTSTTGAPLAGVAVVSARSVATTDATGHYQLKVTPGDAVVRFRLEGYVESIKKVAVAEASPTQLHVGLLPAAPAVTVPAGGGQVSGSGGATVSIPSNAFVSPQGQPISDDVKVRLTNIDPTTVPVRNAASGGFTANTGAGLAQLESFGLISIDVRDPLGRKLQVASGSQLEVVMPVAQGATSRDSSMPLWSFNEASGEWDPEGTVALDTTGNTYMASLGHMSTWNLDKPYLATCVAGCVADRNSSAPLPGASVHGDGLDYLGSSSTTAGADGCFRLAVRKSASVRITGTHASGGGTSVDVTTGTADTAVPPTPGTSCLDAGTLLVEKDVYTYGDATTDCTALLSTMTGAACQSDMANLMACYRPAGGCTMSQQAQGQVITTTSMYGSGAYNQQIIDTEDPAGFSALTTEFHGVDGALCYSMRIESASSFVILAPDSKEYRMAYDENANSMTTTCPDGSRFIIDGATSAAMSACQPQQSSTGGTCSLNVPGSCTSSADCASSGGTCCSYVSVAFCTTSAGCASVDGGVLP